MKTFFLSVGLAILSMSFTLQSGIEPIVNAFKNANAEEIGKQFDDFVDFKVLNRDEVKNLGRNQAIILLRSFYKEYLIKGFEKISDREIGNTMYLAGKLISEDKNAKGYNITIMLRHYAGKYQITSVRIS